MLEQCDVVLRTVKGNRWFMTFQANNFAHAEQQCWDALESDDDLTIIIAIHRDYTHASYDGPELDN